MKFSKFRQNLKEDSSIIANQVLSGQVDNPQTDDTDDEPLPCSEGLDACLEAVETEEIIEYTLDDGSTVEITPEQAANILLVYEQLDAESADKFNVMMVFSEETFIAATEFCNNFILEEDGE